MFLSFHLGARGEVTDVSVERPYENEEAAVCAAKALRGIRIEVPLECTDAHSTLQLKPNCVCNDVEASRATARCASIVCR